MRWLSRWRPLRQILMIWVWPVESLLWRERTYFWKLYSDPIAVPGTSLSVGPSWANMSPSVFLFVWLCVSTIDLQSNRTFHPSFRYSTMHHLTSFLLVLVSLVSSNFELLSGFALQVPWISQCHPPAIEVSFPPNFKWMLPVGKRLQFESCCWLVELFPLRPSLEDQE